MTTQRFRFFTAGESHGQGLTAIIEGVPAGLNLSESDIAIDFVSETAMPLCDGFHES